MCTFSLRPFEIKLNLANIITGLNKKIQVISHASTNQNCNVWGLSTLVLSRSKSIRFIRQVIAEFLMSLEVGFILQKRGKEQF